MKKYSKIFLLFISLFLFIPFAKADVFAYVPDHVGVQNQHGNLRVVNVSYDVIVESIELFGNPRDVLINKTGDTVFVTTELEELGEEKSFLNIIDTSNNTLSGTPEIPGNFARGMVMTNDESKLFVTHDRGVSVLNPYSASPSIQFIETDFRGTNLVITEDEQYLFVIGTNDNDVDGVSLVSLKSPANVEVSRLTLGLGKESASGIYLADENKFFVVNRGVDAHELIVLSVVNYQTPESASLTNIDTHTFPVGSAPSDILYHQKNNELLVSLSYIVNEEPTSDIENGYIAVLNASDTSKETTSGLSKIFLSDEGGTDNQFPPVHPTSISLDEFGRIYVVKHIWNEFAGLYLSKLNDSNRNGIRSVTDPSSLKLGDRSATLSNGTFIGPECSACPTGLDHDPDDNLVRPSSITMPIFGLFIILLLTRLGKRSVG